MEIATHDNWTEANQRYLMAALGRVKRALRSRAEVVARADASRAAAPGRADDGDTPASDSTSELSGDSTHESCEAEARRMSAPPALHLLASAFGLSQFERDVVLMCAGMELDGSFPELCARAHGDSQRRHPTFSLALAGLPAAHWSALAPSAPLRQWRLIEIESGPSLVASPLRIDERVLHYLAGVPHLDERLTGFLTPVGPASDLVPSHREIAEQVTAVWTGTPQGRQPERGNRRFGVGQARAQPPSHGRRSVAHLAGRPGHSHPPVATRDDPGRQRAAAGLPRRRSQ